MQSCRLNLCHVRQVLRDILNTTGLCAPKCTVASAFHDRSHCGVTCASTQGRNRMSVTITAARSDSIHLGTSAATSASTAANVRIRAALELATSASTRVRNSSAICASIIRTNKISFGVQSQRVRGLVPIIKTTSSIKICTQQVTKLVPTLRTSQ